MDSSSDSKNGVAFGSPGIPPRWTSSQKDGIGTAYSSASRVWFTISHGILNEIYYPTIDRPQNAPHWICICNPASFIGDYFGNASGGSTEYTTSVSTFDDGSNPHHYQQQVVASVPIPKQ